MSSDVLQLHIFRLYQRTIAWCDLLYVNAERAYISLNKQKRRANNHISLKPSRSAARTIIYLAKQAEAQHEQSYISQNKQKHRTNDHISRKTSISAARTIIYPPQNRGISASDVSPLSKHFIISYYNEKQTVTD